MLQRWQLYNTSATSTVVRKTTNKTNAHPRHRLSGAVMQPAPPSEAPHARQRNNPKCPRANGKACQYPPDASQAGPSATQQRHRRLNKQKGLCVQYDRITRTRLSCDQKQEIQACERMGWKPSEAICTHDAGCSMLLLSRVSRERWWSEARCPLFPSAFRPSNPATPKKVGTTRCFTYLRRFDRCPCRQYGVQGRNRV